MALAGLLGLIFGCCCKKENEVEDFEEGGGSDAEEEEGDTRCIIPGEIILRMRRGRTGPAVAGIGGISHHEVK